MTEEQIQRLESIGMFRETRSERQWMEQYYDAKEYFEQHGDLNVDIDYISPSGRKTRYWLDRQRRNYQLGKLTHQQIRLAKSIGLI